MVAWGLVGSGDQPGNGIREPFGVLEVFHLDCGGAYVVYTLAKLIKLNS